MNRIIIIMTLFLPVIAVTGQRVLLFEDFETGNFAAKGWYDGFPDQRTTSESKNGSHSFEGYFAKGTVKSGAGRHLFSPTERVYISYWVKYSANWVGSGVSYHPHEWSVLTNEDGIYQGPADSYLTLYIEQNAGRPILAIQDSKNVDPNCILLNNNSFVGCNGNFNTYPFNENRSVCSCNGIKGYSDRRDCFANPGSTHGYYSARIWDADTVYFRNTPGPYYKNNWHFVEAYFEMNSIKKGIGVPDGKIRYWYDRQLLISSDSILFRTGIHPGMKFNQLLYVPYIGVGSPVNQTWWVDDLTVADGIPVSRADKNLMQTDLKIFPNPSDGKFTIENAENIDFIEGYNVLGEKILTIYYGKQQKFFKIDISYLLKGIYLLKIYDRHEICCRKVLIKQ